MGKLFTIQFFLVRIKGCMYIGHSQIFLILIVDKMNKKYLFKFELMQFFLFLSEDKR